jgi:ribosome-binding protein aMBF1 (putative translation factor)
MPLTARDLMNNSTPNKPEGPTEWSRAIETLRRSMKQAQLGKKLEISAMAVFRWERGEAQPSSDGYIRLGKLAGDPFCWFLGAGQD